MNFSFAPLQPQMQRSPIPNSLSQMSPLSLVTHASQQNPHHRLMGAPGVGQLPNIVPHDIEQRMLEYIKLFQAPKDMKRKLSTCLHNFFIKFSLNNGQNLNLFVNNEIVFFYKTFQNCLFLAL